MDVVLKCGFGVNCDNLILCNGVVVGFLYNFLVIIERVEVLKGFVFVLYGI